MKKIVTKKIVVKKITVGIVAVATLLAGAAPAAAYRILDKDKAHGSGTAVAKSWSKGYRQIGFAIGAEGTEKLGFSYWINCPAADWWRSRHGTVTVSGGKAATWIVHPPGWARCNETMKGWLVDNTGTVVVIIGAG